MAKKKVRKPKITKGERLLYCVIIFTFVFSLGIKTFCGAMVSELKISIEEEMGLAYNNDNIIVVNE